VPAHIPPLAAVERVGTVVEQLPGAFWVSWSGVAHARQRKWVWIYRRRPRRWRVIFPVAGYPLRSRERDCRSDNL
jgi:hypothetical protein